MGNIDGLLNPKPSQEATIAITASFTFVTILFVLARSWIVRTKKKTRATRWSEVFLLLGVLMTIGNLVLTSQRLGSIIKANYGPRAILQIWETVVSPSAFKVWYASCVLYNGVLWIVKFAFLALYWNLFERVQGGLRWVLPGAVIVTVAAFLVQLISFFAWCRPISNNWDGEFLDIVACSPIMSLKYMMMLGGLNIANDLIIVLVPLSILKVANFRRREALALGCVFGIGLISVIAGAVRMVLMYQVFGVEFANIGAHNKLTIVSNAEICTAIITFCLPAFRVLIVRRRGVTKGSSGQSQHGSRTLSRIHQSRSGRKGTLDYELEESRNESEERLRDIPGSGIYVTKDVVMQSQSALGVRGDESYAGSRRSETEVFAEVFVEHPAVRPWKG